MMPTRPGLWMKPGMMPTLHSPGVMTPGQFGPTSRHLPPASAAFTRTMSLTGMPSVMQTIEADAGIRRLEDRVRRERRRHVDHADVGLGRLHRVVHGVEYRPVEVRVPPRPGVTPPTRFVP